MSTHPTHGSKAELFLDVFCGSRVRHLLVLPHSKRRRFAKRRGISSQISIVDSDIGCSLMLQGGQKRVSMPRTCVVDRPMVDCDSRRRCRRSCRRCGLARGRFAPSSMLVIDRLKYVDELSTVIDEATPIVAVAIAAAISGRGQTRSKSQDVRAAVAMIPTLNYSSAGPAMNGS